MIQGQIPRLLPDVSADPVAGQIPAARDAGIAAYLGAPVRLADGELYGTLCAASGTREPDLGPRDLAFLDVLADLLADHLERSQGLADRHRAQNEFTALAALLAALDARDHYTGAHSEAVVELSREVAGSLGLDPSEMEAVAHVALLHDLGKVGIPDAVLQKPEALTDSEWELMREHPGIGARIVAAIEPLAHLAPAVRAEHERFDGLGYPDGLRGEEVPIAARITLACDAYHAMVSDRPYRAALGHERACRELAENAGGQFDPAVIAALLDVLGSRSPARETAARAVSGLRPTG